MKEQIISFETAKLAKKKGFDIFTRKAWIKKKGEKLFFTPSFTGITKGTYYYAPTQHFLQKWLRVEHSIHIEISYCLLGYCFSLYNIEDEDFTVTDYVKHHYKSYEDCLEKALKKALKSVKNG